MTSATSSVSYVVISFHPVDLTVLSVWEDQISELNNNSSQSGNSSSTSQTPSRNSQISESPSLPPSTPGSSSRSLPLPSNSQSPIRSPSGSTTMNGLSTPFSTPTKRDRAAMSTGGSAPRRFNDPESRARRLAAIQAATGELDAERQAQDSQDQCISPRSDIGSEYGMMDTDGEDEPIPKRLRFTTGSIDSPLITPTRIGNGSVGQSGSPTRTSTGALMSPPATGGLPDVFGIHNAAPVKRESEAPSSGMFTNVNGSTNGKGKQRESPLPSTSRSASMASSSSVKIESNASVRPNPSILSSLSKLIPSFLSSQQLSSSQPSLPAVQTPLSHINKLRERDNSLDAQVQEFLSVAGQIYAGPELVKKLYEEIKVRDGELAELKKKNSELAELKIQYSELNAKYNK